ncbi:DUF5667 domain-containing protein [Sphaerisporangium sp. TRM90804]|uniref:DUF5667 domain-containing protein n=1 Tax=Sphaerisporangium sp. TRM90804 TaxID=3031113 RepID=UPI0024494863|nr:DUF5667 domain-containing protein [Sphaerisporangium sp. TRM90804]MDH2426786.1 DUF5667 domain-containing protein [Sphaerisporangium sp. TRM90804]
MGWWRPSRWLRDLWAAVTLRRTTIIGRLRRIGAEPRTGPSHDFRSRLREELLAAQASARESAGAEAGRHRRRPPRLARLRPAALVMAVTGLMLFTGVETYASVPGDHLYAIKRAAEATLLSLTPDDEQRAQRELTAAHSRATEAAALLGYPDSARERLIGPTLDEMTSRTRSALSALKHVKKPDKHRPELKRFTEQQRDVVEPMIPQLGGDDRVKASAYLDMIDDLTP